MARVGQVYSEVEVIEPYLSLRMVAAWAGGLSSCTVRYDRRLGRLKTYRWLLDGWRPYHMVTHKDMHKYIEERAKRKQVQMVTAHGHCMSIRGWAKVLNRSIPNVRVRLKKYPPEQALRPNKLTRVERSRVRKEFVALHPERDERTVDIAEARRSHVQGHTGRVLLRHWRTESEKWLDRIKVDAGLPPEPAKNRPLTPFLDGAEEMVFRKGATKRTWAQSRVANRKDLSRIYRKPSRTSRSHKS